MSHLWVRRVNMQAVQHVYLLNCCTINFRLSHKLFTVLLAPQSSGFRFRRMAALIVEPCVIS
jgi:hypothetical protein